MLQVVELERNWEQHRVKSGNKHDRILHRANPQKSLLFRPAVEDVVVHMSVAASELAHSDSTGTPGDAILLYISADGCEDPMDTAWSGCQLRPSRTRQQCYKKHTAIPSSGCPQDILSADDLRSATRQALLIVVDSPGAKHFQSLESKFGQPLLVLMAPLVVDCGNSLRKPSQKQVPKH